MRKGEQRRRRGSTRRALRSTANLAWRGTATVHAAPRSCERRSHVLLLHSCKAGQKDSLHIPRKSVGSLQRYLDPSSKANNPKALKFQLAALVNTDNQCKQSRNYDMAQNLKNVGISLG